MASDSTQSRSQGAQQPSRLRSLLQLPTPIRYLFDRTPLLTYPTNELPLRALAQYNPRTGSSGESSNVLYIFTTEEEAKRGSPSFNPGCLKLQTLLKLHGVHFTCRPSSNHASPTGALPFLLTLNPEDPTSAPTPISSRELPSYLKLPTNSPKSCLYIPLLSHNIRLAYLHALYLDVEIFKSVTMPRYVETCTGNTAVRAVLAHSLRSAAEEEILKSCGIVRGGMERVDVRALYARMEEAWAALAQILGHEEWFEGVLGGGIGTEEEGGEDGGRSGVKTQSGPGVLDASIFAYSHVVLALLMDWPGREEMSGRGLDALSAGNRLYEAIARHGNLVAHRDRILARYFEYGEEG